jgi:hypothetical protein
MPLLFALAGIVALVLALVVLAAPIVLVVSVVKAVRHGTPLKHSSQTSPAQEDPPPAPVEAASGPTFVDVISVDWPEEAADLRHSAP